MISRDFLRIQYKYHLQFAFTCFSSSRFSVMYVHDYWIHACISSSFGFRGMTATVCQKIARYETGSSQTDFLQCAAQSFTWCLRGIAYSMSTFPRQMQQYLVKNKVRNSFLTNFTQQQVNKICFSCSTTRHSKNCLPLFSENRICNFIQHTAKTANFRR